VKPQLGLLKSTMLQLNPAFTERDFGTSAFSDFVQKLSNAGYVKLRREEGNFVVERGEAPPHEAEPRPSSTREDAVPLLRSVLEANLPFLSVGIPAKELAALFHAGHPQFSHQQYGFTGFEELLNLAQDKGLVRIEADPERGLRVFAGQEMGAAPVPAQAAHISAAAEEEVQPVPTAPPARKPARRRSSRGGRSTGGRRRSSRAKKPEPAAVTEG
jgi:hypothetical protein